MTKRSSTLPRQTTTQPLAPASLVSDKVFETRQQPPSDEPKATVQSLEPVTEIPVAIQNAWHSKLVVPQTVTIDGGLAVMTQGYTFAVNERKDVGDWDPAHLVHPDDALILLNLTAGTGGCCGSSRRKIHVFEGVYE